MRFGIFAEAWTSAARAPESVPLGSTATPSGAKDDSLAEADESAGARVADAGDAGGTRGVETSAADPAFAAARLAVLAGYTPESGLMPESRSNRILADCAPHAGGETTASSADAVALAGALSALGDSFAPASCTLFLAWIEVLLPAAFAFLVSGLSRVLATPDSAFFAPETAKEVPEAALSLAAARAAPGSDGGAGTRCRMAPISGADAASADALGKANPSPWPTPALGFDGELPPEPNCCSIREKSRPLPEAS